MYYYYLVVWIIIVTTVFTYINHKSVRLPAAIAVIIFSVITSAVLLVIKKYFPEVITEIQRSISSVNFNALVMNVLLGLLLFAGSFKLDLNELKKEAKAILSLALFSTCVSTFTVGYLIYLFLQVINYPIPLIDCFLFGALISPTDPLAALSILQKAGIPKSFELKVTGESLVNDGIAIVIFTTIYQVAASDQPFVFLDSLTLFAKEAGGGFLFGCLLGYGGFFAIKTINNYKVEILITIVIATAGYSVANMMHVSGPLAMVVAGLITGGKRKERIMSDESTSFVNMFWSMTDDFLNVVLFLLIGFEMLVIPLESSIIFTGIVAIIILLVSRFVSILLPVYALKKYFEKNAIPILTWGALRGAVSIALALTIPARMHRQDILALTYFIAVFSIIVQGLTIGKLTKRLEANSAEKIKTAKS